MGAGEFVITTYVRGHCNFACRRLCPAYLALGAKGSYDLNAEVDIHRFIGMSRMMVEETIMPAGPQALMVTEELPNEIKRRPPGPANVSAEHAPPYGREHLGR